MIGYMWTWIFLSVLANTVTPCCLSQWNWGILFTCLSRAQKWAPCSWEQTCATCHIEAASVRHAAQVWTCVQVAHLSTVCGLIHQLLVHQSEAVFGTCAVWTCIWLYLQWWWKLTKLTPNMRTSQCSCVILRKVTNFNIKKHDWTKCFFFILKARMV